MNRHLVESEKWTSTCPSSVGRKFQLFAAAIMFGVVIFCWCRNQMIDIAATVDLILISEVSVRIVGAEAVISTN